MTLILILRQLLERQSYDNHQTNDSNTFVFENIVSRSASTDVKHMLIVLVAHPAGKEAGIYHLFANAHATY